MEKLNKKGFTLVELIATIVVLSIVVSIGSYSITNIIKNAKEKDYNLLINNIKDAAETYYQECKYSDNTGNNTGIDCNIDPTLKDLITYGYLKGNGTDDKKMNITNPKDDNDISDCKISINYENNHIKIKTISGPSSCPKEEEYQ